MNYIASGKRTIEIERDAVDALLAKISASFNKACELMLACEGRIVVTGMGKSGHIANKIAATLASTGTPAFFVHPGEASHGDLGMITKQDVVLAISNSGQTDEVLKILPLIKRMGAPLISMTGNANSALALAADAQLDISIEKEACPLNLAPTSSTTVTLVLGDALAVALLEARGFSEEDFAFSHPGGSLGRKLLLTVEELMHTGDRVPAVLKSTSLSEGLFEISSKGFGLTAIINEDEKVLGLFTDGDLRRAFDNDTDLRKTNIGDIMTVDCKTISKTAMAAEALHVMEEFKITGLLVTGKDRKLEGVIHMHDLLRAGVV